MSVPSLVKGCRSGQYDRRLNTTSGDVTLKVPQFKGISFETAIIERYRRRDSSAEEALSEMYLAGVSVRRVDGITEALWGSKVSPSTISELNRRHMSTLKSDRTGNAPSVNGRKWVASRLIPNIQLKKGLAGLIS